MSERVNMWIVPSGASERSAQSCEMCSSLWERRADRLRQSRLDAETLCQRRRVGRRVLSAEAK